MVQFAEWWAGFGVACLLLAGVTIGSYGAPDLTRRSKFLLTITAYMIFIVGSGALAFGLTWRARTDGFNVLWGNWLMYGLCSTLAFGVVCYSFTRQARLAYWGMALALLQGAVTLFLSLNPNGNAGANGARILFETLIWVFWAMQVVYLMVLAFKLLPWLTQRARTLARTGSSGMVVPPRDRTNEVSGSVQSSVALAIAGAFYMIFQAILPLLLILGPEDRRIYTNWTTQLNLVIFLGYFVWFFAALLVIYFVFNPDGEIYFSFWNLFAPGSDVEDRTAELDNPLAMANKIGTKVSRQRKQQRAQESEGNLLAEGDMDL